MIVGALVLVEVTAGLVVSPDTAARQALFPHELFRRACDKHLPGKSHVADDGAPDGLF